MRSGHLLLLHLVVYNVTGGQLAPDLLRAYTKLDHEYHDVVGEVGYLVHRLAPVSGVPGDDDLGRFLANFFKYLVQALLEKIGRVAALRLLGLAAFEQGV